MTDLLLAIDVGNTNLTFGIFNGSDIVGSFRMTTKMPRTSDEFGIWILDLLRARGYEKSQISDVIIASVVPAIMHSLGSAIIKYVDRTPIVVGTGTKTGLKINATNPRELGTDRVVDLVAGLEIYGGPIMVIDFGTATTYDVVLADGTFECAITSPGIRVSA